jgi:hypothetical protein
MCNAYLGIDKESHAMNDYRIDFTQITWNSPLDGLREKIVIQDGKKFRLLEYSHRMALHWCEQSHFGYIIDGRFEIEFKDGLRIFEKGD